MYNITCPGFGTQSGPRAVETWNECEQHEEAPKHMVSPEKFWNRQGSGTNIASVKE